MLIYVLNENKIDLQDFKKVKRGYYPIMCPAHLVSGVKAALFNRTISFFITKLMEEKQTHSKNLILK